MCELAIDEINVCGYCYQEYCNGDCEEYFRSLTSDDYYKPVNTTEVATQTDLVDEQHDNDRVEADHR